MKTARATPAIHGLKNRPTSGSTWRTYFSLSSMPFWSIHVIAIVGVMFSDWSWSRVALAFSMYYAGVFFITGAFHRYFSHRSYKTSRWFQFLLALGGTATAQKGVLWWAGNHRHHHRHSDLEADLHSPVQRGFWWSHVGWILSPDYQETKWENIRDFARFPELRLLNHWNMVPPVALGAILYFAGDGWSTLLWGLFVPMVMLWHGTFTINSLSHVFGRRPYDTEDDSRNNVWLALITMGEGWHNNHHHHASSANQGFHWYQIDATYYVLKLLELCRLVRDVRKAPAHIVAGRRRTPKKRSVESQELAQAA